MTSRENDLFKDQLFVNIQRLFKAFFKISNKCMLIVLFSQKRNNAKFKSDYFLKWRTVLKR